MFRITPTRLTILLVIASAVGALVALRFAKRQMAGMSEEELRDYVDAKLSSRLSDEQLAQIQDALVKVADRIRVADSGEGPAPPAEDEVAEDSVPGDA